MRYLWILLLVGIQAFAVSSLQQMGTSLLGSFTALGNLLLNTAYVAGIGFGITAAYKFKQHKDNPAQVSIGMSIAMLFISIFLVFLPGIFKPAGASLFGGSSQRAGGATGSGMIYMPGGVDTVRAVTPTN